MSMSATSISTAPTPPEILPTPSLLDSSFTPKSTLPNLSLASLEIKLRLVVWLPLSAAWRKPWETWTLENRSRPKALPEELLEELPGVLLEVLEELEVLLEELLEELLQRAELRRVELRRAVLVMELPRKENDLLTIDSLPVWLAYI